MAMTSEHGVDEVEATAPGVGDRDADQLWRHGPFACLGVHGALLKKKILMGLAVFSAVVFSCDIPALCIGRSFFFHAC